MHYFFWKASAEAFRQKQPRSRFCQLEGIGIPLRSGLVILNSATIHGKINPTDSVIPPDFTSGFKGIKQRAGLSEPKHHRHCFSKKM